jgi:hypothetical protein
MNMDFEKTMAMINGQSVDTFMQNQLTFQDKAQIDNAIDFLFSGLSLKNWIQGGILSSAWTKALDTLRDMIFAIPQNNPATKYMQAETFRHRQRWHIKIIESRNANEVIRCNAEQREAWMNDANTKIQNSIEILRQKVMAFESDESPVNKPSQKTQVLCTPENTKQINSREYEYERVRDE